MTPLVTDERLKARKIVSVAGFGVGLFPVSEGMISAGAAVAGAYLYPGDSPYDDEDLVRIYQAMEAVRRVQIQLGPEDS